MSDQRICWSDVWTRTRRSLTNWTASTNAENYRRAHCRDGRRWRSRPTESIKRRLSGDLLGGERGVHGLKRRDFLIAAGALLAGPLAAKAQQAPRVFRIGYLSA